MHGLVKISVRNPDGSLALEQSGKNLITNAAQRLLSPPSAWLMGSSSFNTAYYNQLMPMATKMLGGLLLWGTALPELPSTLIPPNPFDQVGHAGAAYSGDSIRRGSYNNLESGAVEGGYKHVWDFNTNQANGVINALSATTVEGGDTGWFPDPDTLAADGVPQALWGMDGNFLNSNACFAIWGAYSNVTILIGKKGTFLYYAFKNNAEITITRIRVEPDDLSEVGLLRPALSSSGGGQLAKDVFTLTAERAVSFPQWWHVTDTEILIPTWVSTTTFHLARISLATMTITHQGLITAPAGGSFGSSIIYGGVEMTDNYMYLRATPAAASGFGDTAWKVDLNNLSSIVEVARRVPNYRTDSQATSRFRLYLPEQDISIISINAGGDAYISQGDSSHPCRLNTQILGFNLLTSFTSPDLFPFILACGWRNQYNTYMDPCPQYVTPVLTSIYNLPSPIVKSPGQTMKIEYTFLEGEAV